MWIDIECASNNETKRIYFIFFVFIFEMWRDRIMTKPVCVCACVDSPNYVTFFLSLFISSEISFFSLQSCFAHYSCFRECGLCAPAQKLKRALWLQDQWHGTHVCWWNVRDLRAVKIDTKHQKACIHSFRRIYSFWKLRRSEFSFILFVVLYWHCCHCYCECPGKDISSLNYLLACIYTK